MEGAASHLIFFIVGISLALGVSGVLLNSVQDIQSGIETKGAATSKAILSDITILHVDVGSDIKVYTSNNGKTPLDLNKSNLLVDGRWILDNQTTLQIVNKSTNKVNPWWDPNEVLLITYANTSNLSAGRHKTKVVTVEGTSDEYEFDV